MSPPKQHLRYRAGAGRAYRRCGRHYLQAHPPAESARGRNSRVEASRLLLPHLRHNAKSVRPILPRSRTRAVEGEFRYGTPLPQAIRRGAGTTRMELLEPSGVPADWAWAVQVRMGDTPN